MDINQMTDDEIREELAQRARKTKIFPLNKNWADSPLEFGKYQQREMASVEPRKTSDLLNSLIDNLFGF